MKTRLLGTLFSMLFGIVSTVQTSAAGPVLDTDGDGSPDAFEYFLRTDPLDPQSIFKIRSVRAIRETSRTRVSWFGTAGRPFRLQASGRPDGTWNTLATFEGSGVLIEHDLPMEAGVSERYYRLATDFDTNRPPWIGLIESDVTSVTGLGAAVLRMQAWHPSGLDEVVFFRGDQVLGVASPNGDFEWQFAWVPDAVDNGPAAINAEVRTGTTILQSPTLNLQINIVVPPQPAYLTANPDQFVLLDGQGKPIANSVVRADAAGNLPPCEWRPTGFPTEGNLASIGIRFPEGALIVGETLEFNRSQLASGPLAPLQPTGELRTNARRTLRLGAITVADLTALYDQPAAEGLPISIYGKVEARLLAGTFSERGLVSPRFTLAKGTLPFGDVLGGLEGVVLELGENGFISLPLAGEFPLAQAGGPAATIRIGTGTPAWVKLGFDGSLRMEGRAELEFANGPKFGVGLTLRDPVFGMELSAGKLQASAAGWLRTRLPQATSLTEQSTSDNPTLNSAARLLTTKAKAFERYAAGFRNADSSPLEIVGLSLLGGAAIDAGSTEIKAAIDHSARQGSAAHEATAAARQWIYLERLRLGGLTSAELTSAQNEAKAALKRRLEKAGEPLSIKELQETLAVLLEQLRLAQSLGVSADQTALLRGCEIAMAGAVQTFAESCGVKPGVFAPPAAGIIARDRFVLYQDLATLTGIRRDAQLLGVQLNAAALLSETLAQIAAHLDTVLRLELRRAEVAGDEMAFLDAMAEYLFLRQQNDLGVFAGANLSLLGFDELSSRLSALALAAARKPAPTRALAKRYQEAGRIGKLLDAVPPNVIFPAPPIRRSYDALQAALARAFTTLSQATREELLNILLAGNASARIRDQMIFDEPAPTWESLSRRSAVVDLLAAKCVSDDDATTAFAAAQSLFSAADRLVSRPDFRKGYLLEAQKFVVALRAIALARQSAAPPSTADGLLAGGIAIDEIAGGLIYDTRARILSGWASGKLRLPGVDASFTMNRAEFNTGGSFSVSAYGSVPLPGSAARFSVTPRRPLIFKYDALDGMSVAGGGKLEVNGMTYEAWMSLDEPNYIFGAAFSGLNFDLAQSLRVMIPTWPNAQRFPPAVVRDVNQYVRDFGSSLEELGISLATSPALREAGSPPEFEPPFGGEPFGALSAWASAEIADAALGLPRDYGTNAGTIIRQLESLKARYGSRPPADICTNGVTLAEAAAAMRVKERLAKAIAFKKAKVPAEPTADLEAKMAEVDLLERAYLVCLLSAPSRHETDVETQILRLLGVKVQRTANGLDPLIPSGWETVYSAALAYHKRTFATALTEAGLNTATGNAAPDGVVLRAHSDEKLALLTDNFMYRRGLAAVLRDDSVTHTPAGTTDRICTRALLHLFLQRRERMIRQSWEVELTMPQWPPAQPGGEAPVDRENADVIRAYAERSKNLAIDWMNFLDMFMRWGMDAELGLDPVLKFSDGSLGSFSFNDDLGAATIGIDQLAGAITRTGNPSTKRRGPLPNGQIRELRSDPIYEGLWGLEHPIGSYSESQRERFRMVGLQRRTVDQTPPQVQQLWRTFQLAKAGVAGPSANGSLNAALARLDYEVERYVTTPIAERTLGDGLVLARQLRNLTLAAELQKRTDLQTTFHAKFAMFDNAFKAAAEAQNAWWYLAEYTDILLEAADAYADGAITASREFFSNTASETARASISLLSDLSFLLPSQRPIDIALPGDLRIDDVSGEIRYNRSTRHLQGNFGGSLSFPNIEANFKVVDLHIDNQGSLSIEATASGPLPRVPGARLNGSVSMSGKFALGGSGQPPVVLTHFATSGSGQLLLPDDVTLQGTFAYDTASRILEFTGRGDHLNLKLSDHFVLLNGVAGMRFGGIGPNSFPSSGRFDLGGTFGLFSKSLPALNQPLAAEHFHMAAVDALARLEILTDRVNVSLPNGKLALPSMFQSTNGGRAEIAIQTNNPPQISLRLGAPNANNLRAIEQAIFTGGVTFDHLGLVIPSFQNAGARDFRGALDFGNLTLNPRGQITAATAPKLSIANGFVFFPHPIEATRIELQADNIAWKLDGLPQGTLRLATDVGILDLDTFRLSVVGGPDTNLTGVVIGPDRIRMFGAMRALVDNTLLFRETTNVVLQGIPTGQFGAQLAGELTIHAPVGNALPVADFTLGDFVVTGDFRVGGPNGVRVKGLAANDPAKVVFSGLANLFQLSPQRPFVIGLTGKIVQEGLPGFGLGDARFVFSNYTEPPQFIAPETLVYDGSSWTLAQQIPVELREAKLRFLRRDLPLADLIKPGNLEITSTFRMGFPSVADPVIGGGADGVKITFQPDGTPQLQNLEGIQLTLDPGLDIPPIEDLGGTLYVTGFSNPANLMLAGKLGGSVNSYKMNFVAAMTTTGPLGIALDVNAGSAGYPLPFGFLFTGAGGGISFLNTSADPMDLHSYLTAIEGRIQANPQRPPPPATMNWAGFKEWRAKMLSQIPAFPPIGTGPTLSVIAPGTFPANDPIGCPVDIPPASANIFGMPHPDQERFPGRYILKFSSIPEDTLNKPIPQLGMGITRDSIAALGQRGTTLAATLATQIRAQLQQTTPPVPSVLGPGAQQAAVDWLNQLEQGFAIAFAQGLTGLPVNATADQLYAAIRDKAYEGVSMRDATLAVKGVFTHAAISAFMNVEGGGTIGTTGSAGVAGRVNFLGLPVGLAELFFSATDINGNPNPQLTGNIEMALGPLQIGHTKAALKAEGAMTGLAAVVGQIATTLGGAARDRILADMDRSFAGLTFAQAEQLATQNVPPAQRAQALAMFHTAFMAQILRQPPGSLSETLIGQVASLFDQVNPELVICSEATVKFAGLKISNGLANMKFRLRKTGREAYFDVSPAGFIGYGTPISILTSGIDRGSVSYAETFPDVTGLIKRLLNGRLSSPEAIEAAAREQLDIMLENSTMTGSYEVSPLGMNLFRAQLRMINPDFLAHPIVRNNNGTSADDWIRPGTASLSGLPTREQLLLQAVRKNVLADVFWKGNGANLPGLYDNQIAGLQGRTLKHDYFPHGGMVMAAMLDVPRIFATLPRTQWAVLNNPAAEPFTRLQALREIMRDYFGATVQQGNFMAYVPLPNPPALFNANGTPIIPPPSLNPLQMIQSLETFNPEDPRTGSAWDLQESFAYLNLNGTLIDIPIGEVNLAAYGPDPGTGKPARFAGEINFPPDSWASLLYGPIRMTASVTGQQREPRRTIAQALAGLQAQDLLGSAPSDAAIRNAIEGLAQSAASLIAQDLPRVELAATIQSLTPPSSWNWPQIDLLSTANLHAYSPEYIQSLPAGATALQRLQKTGGIAAEGTIRLAGLASVDGQVLFEPPTAVRQRPRATAALTGHTVNLPFGGLRQASVQFDTESAQFLTIRGALQADLDLTAQTGWPIRILAGANVAIDNQTATFTYSSGGATATITANYANPLNPIFSIQGQLAFHPLTNNAISIVPKPGTGDKLLVQFGAAPARVTNARVRVGGFFNKEADLPEFTVTPGLNFNAVSIQTPFAGLVQGFTLNNLTWSVQRINGVLTIPNASGSAQLPALGQSFAVNLSGPVQPTGGFSLTGFTGFDGFPTGLPIEAIKAPAPFTFTNGLMRTVATVTGGLLNTGILPGLASLNGAEVILSPTAVTGFLVNAFVPSVNLGNFKIRPASGLNLSVTQNLSGLVIPQGNLFFDPLSTTTPLVASPQLTVPSLSAALPAPIWNASVPMSGSFAGFALSQMTFVLERASLAPLRYQLRNVNFQAPQPAGFAAGAFLVSGGSIDSIVTSPNLPIISLPPLDVGRFHLENLGTPSLSTNGIRFLNPRLRADGVWSNQLTIPATPLDIPANGALNINTMFAGDLLPSLGRLNGFTLRGASFNIFKSGSTMSLPNFTANLPVPGFIANTVQLNGTIPSSGAINLNGSAIPQLAIDKIALRGIGGGELPNSLNSDNGWLFTAGVVDVTDLFSTAAPVAGSVAIDVPPNPSADATFASFTIAPVLRGYALGASAVRFERVAGAARLAFTSSSLPLPNGPNIANLGGSISSAGLVTLNGSLDNSDFYGFPVSANFSFGTTTIPWSAFITDTGPRSWWPLNESTGTAAQDAVSGLAASTTSTTTRPQLLQPSAFRDGSGSSMRFDGVDDFYSIPDNAVFEGGNAMSVGCWFKVNQFTPGKAFHTLIAKGDDSWRIAQDGTANYLSFDSNSSVSQHALRASLVPVNDGQWHYVVATYDGVTKRLYIDGVLRASENWAGPIRDSAYPVTIGSNAQQPNRNWNGWIDEVAFWNRALDPSEVHGMYNRGNGLDLTFNGQVNLRGPGTFVLQQFRPTFAGSVNSAGEFELFSNNSAATLLGFGFNDIDLAFTRRILPVAAVSVTGAATLNTLTLQPFSLNPRFNVQFTRSAGNTVASLSAPDQTVNLGGFTPAAPGFDLALSGNLGASVPISFSNFRFGNSTLAALNLPALGGAMQNNGRFDITSPFIADVTLAGFRAPSAAVDFSSDGLYVSGSFDLYATVGIRRYFGSVNLDGYLSPSASFTLNGSGQIQVGGFIADSVNLSLNSVTRQLTASSSPQLNFGATKFPISGFSLRSDAFSGSMSKTFNSITVSHLADHLETTWSPAVSLGYNFGTGLLTGTATGNWSWRVTNFSVPSGFSPSGSFSVNGSIGTSGDFTVNDATTTASYFFAPAWPNGSFAFTPPFGWAWGSWTSENYNLW